MMNARWIWNTFLAALRLNTPVMEEQRDSVDGFKQGLVFVVALALVVGLVVGLVGLVQSFTSDPIADIDAAATGMQDSRSMMEDIGMFGEDEEAEEILDAVFTNIEAGMEMAKNITGVVEDTTSAPMSIVSLFNFLGKWISQPFTWVGLWLVWGVMTLFFARLFGGTATIQRMLATTSLAAAPLVLGVFSWVQCLGGLLTFVGWLWALAIYVKCTAVANRMGVGAALLAVLMPVIIAVVLSLLGLFAMGTFIFAVS